MAKLRSINLILFVAIICLGLLAWLDPFAPPEPEFHPLSTVNPETITKISLKRAGGNAFVLQKSVSAPESSWRLREPVDLFANQLKVKQLLSLISTNSLRQYQIKSEHLAKLGLADPAWEIIFEASSGGKTVVSFGKTEPISQKRYVLVNNTVHLINDRVSQFNFGSPLMLANLDILPVDKSVKEVHLPDKVIRRVDGQWQSSSPAERSVSQSTYKEFIDEWRYAQASRVALADKNEFNIDAKPVTVVLEKADQPVHFMIEHSGQDYIVTNKDWGVRYYLSGNVGEKLMHIASNSSEQQ